VLYDDVFNWFTKMCLTRMREAALDMVRQARARGVRVIVSGNDAADAPQVYLEAGAEFVVIGEGEITLGELLARMSSLGPPACACATTTFPAWCSPISACSGAPDRARCSKSSTSCRWPPGT